MTTPDSLPPRKGVMAWEIEPMEENGDEFFVLTFHHGLGRMTRLDLGAEEVQEVARMLTAALASQNADSVFVVGDTAECAHCPDPIFLDDNGAGGTVWCHNFGSTVCGDSPPGTLEDNGRLTTAEPRQIDSSGAQS